MTAGLIKIRLIENASVFDIPLDAKPGLILSP
jgi:hypothetical protein